MSQLPANMTLPTGEGYDEEQAREVDVGSDILPSAGHRSGLTSAVRQHLEQQFLAAGNADPLIRELHARIAEIDSRTVPEDDTDHAHLQAERALLVAKISYVEDDLAVNGVPTTHRSMQSSTDWQDSGNARAVGEPIATGATDDTRRVKIYDSTSDR